MRVLQLIDSMDAGGAERIAVTFANALANHTQDSHLCVTRAEGVLKDQLYPDVGFHFLKKRSTLDFAALFRLRKYLKTHKITVLHAHTTSYFFATFVKIIYPKIKLIWHTHMGERVQSGRTQNKVLYLCSFFFSGIIAVNEELKAWCAHYLATPGVYYLPNFVQLNKFPKVVEEAREESIICLANLKTPKNHLNLIEAFRTVSAVYPNWKLLLAGKDFKDSYSEKLMEATKKAGLQNKVVFLGQQSKVETLLVKSSIGVLASDSEGLPMALLEYGAAGLAVVATRVGHCEEVIGDFGNVVPAQDAKALGEAIFDYVSHPERCKTQASMFRARIREKYSEEAVLPQLLTIYNNSTH
jgi:glycosyltransferase involved in cell wall biosynthesis